MEVQRIRLEGTGAPAPRNVPRVVVEVDIASVNGKGIEGRRCPQGVSKLELYADQLPKLASQTRTAAHLAAYQAASTICQSFKDEWIKEHGKALRGKSEADRALYIEQRCPHRPEQFLHMTGARTGLPSIVSAKVISRDESRSVDVHDFIADDFGDREPFLIDPPVTPESSQDKMSGYLAAIAAAVQGNAGNGQRNSRKG